ncbi:hypothetical protein IFM47457_10994 [Aspergillus lentulus]|nr:hypothetical protein IFM47457_10994 [Aspergillus lentulus]
MAVSEASRLSSVHNQALPSFKELFPTHLHDGIESGPHRLSRQPSSRECPVSSAYGSGSGSRRLSGRTPSISRSKFTIGEVHDYSMADRTLWERAPPQTRLPEDGPHLVVGRQPSPVLPSIRDPLNVPAARLPEHRGSVRTDAFVAQEFQANAVAPPHHSAADFGGSVSGWRSPYAGTSVPATMQARPPCPSHLGPICQIDPEQVPSQSLSPSQQSNLGIARDSDDPKSKRGRRILPKSATDILRAWFQEHLDHPYPSGEDKQMIMARTGLAIGQVSNWFTNARRRRLYRLRRPTRTGSSDFDSQRQ